MQEGVWWEKALQKGVVCRRGVLTGGGSFLRKGRCPRKPRGGRTGGTRKK